MNYGRRIRTAQDRKLDLVSFLAMARPEKVATETPESLAARYGVTIDVARECFANATRLV